MTLRSNQKNNKIQKQWQTLKRNNKGSAIVMVLVAMAFVGIMASLLMYVTFQNYQMKITDHKAKDNFYSAELAMDEIRAALQGIVYDAFSEAFEETLQIYAKDNEKNKNTLFKESYINYLTKILSVTGDPETYDIRILQGFVTKPAMAPGEEGAYVDSVNCDFLAYEDGIRMKDISVTYTDAQGYVSIIEVDILLAIPEMGIYATYEFPQMESYCLIADDKLSIGNGNASAKGVFVNGSVYGGKEGIEMNSKSVLDVKGYQKNGETNPGEAMIITDGEIVLGTDKDFNSTRFSTAGEVSLWTAGIRVQGLISTGNQSTKKEGDGYEVSLQGNTYVQDDFTINSAGTRISLGGTYHGFGNSNTKAENSSAIIINGPNTILNLEKLTELNLGGNAYIATSKIDTSKIDSKYTDKKNNNIKMGNAVASKAEQLAYLIPIECIGYDEVNQQTIVGRNPVNVQDTLYQKFLELQQQEPNNYKEVNLGLIDKTVGKPLSNYGASYEKVYYKPDGENIWVYYYLNFTSALEASRFFKDYYEAKPEALNNYIKNYVQILDIGNRNSEDLVINIVGNMITRDSQGNFKLVEATIGEDVEQQIELNKEYADYSNQFLGLCKKLTTNYASLTAKERKAGVYYNTINTEFIEKCKEQGIFNDKYVVFRNEAADTLALLILANQNEGSMNLYQAFQEAGIEESEWEKVHLVVSQRDIEVKAIQSVSQVKFEGTILVDGVMTIPENDAIFSISENMDNVLLGSYSYNYGMESKKMKALSLFREGKDSKILEDSRIEEEENRITTEELVIYENWTKK